MANWRSLCWASSCGSPHTQLLLKTPVIFGRSGITESYSLWPYGNWYKNFFSWAMQEVKQTDINGHLLALKSMGECTEVNSKAPFDCNGSGFYSINLWFLCNMNQFLIWTFAYPHLQRLTQILCQEFCLACTANTLTTAMCWYILGHQKELLLTIGQNHDPMETDYKTGRRSYLYLNYYIVAFMKQC